MRKLRLFCQALLTLAVLSLFPTCVHAENGEGSNSPLILESCSPASGMSELSADAAITLNFSKNVSNFTVRDNNMTCFSAVDSSGNPIDIVVEIGDDQVDREIRRTIVVRPLSQWPSGETFTLTVSADLASKSGVALGTPVMLTYTTAAVNEPVPAPEPSVDPAPSEQPGPAPEEPAPLPEHSADPTPSEQPGSVPEEPATGPEPAEPSPIVDSSALPEEHSPEPVSSEASDPDSGGEDAAADHAGTEDAGSGQWNVLVPVFCAAALVLAAVAVWFLRKK